MNLYELPPASQTDFESGKSVRAGKNHNRAAFNVLQSANRQSARKN